MGTGSFLEVKSGRSVTLTLHPTPSSAVVLKGRAIPLLHLWAVRPIQSLNGCTGVTFTLTLIVDKIKGHLRWEDIDLKVRENSSNI